MTYPSLRAHLPVGPPYGHPVRLARVDRGAPGLTRLAEGGTHARDGVQGNDVTKWSNVRIANQRQWALKFEN